MSKLIKHEFRATSRIMLPVLVISVLSGLFIAVFNSSQSVSSWIMGIMATIFTMSLFAIFVICIFIVISRFYRNTMTDNGYLTMTLPINMHQFIWSELIVSILWIIIAFAVLCVLGITCLKIIGQFRMVSSAEIGNITEALSDALKRHDISIWLIILFFIEGLVLALAAFIIYCLRFYLAMAIGQIFSNHRILLSVISYMLLGSAITLFFVSALRFLGGINFTGTEFKAVVGILAEIDGIVLVCAALLYIPTAFILSDNLNLP